MYRHHPCSVTFSNTVMIVDEGTEKSLNYYAGFSQIFKHYHLKKKKSQNT